MQRAKATPNAESTAQSSPVSRLLDVLDSEGFSSMHEDEDWQAFGEEVYHREEQVLFARGETVIILINYPRLDEKILSQAVESQANLFRARSKGQKALSVFQTTTVYVCIIAETGMPHAASLEKFVSTAGGAVIIPIIMVPEINQVIYPNVDGRVSPVRPRVDYFRYLIGERREPVMIHKQTVRAFWISMGFVVILGILALVSALF